MTTLTITYRCRGCASPNLTTLTTSRPTPSEQSIIIRCDDCELETQLLVRSLPIGEPRSEALHGTNAAYTRHIRTGTTPCQDCRDAKAAYARERKHR